MNAEKRIERAVALWAALSALVVGAATAAGSGEQEALARTERDFARQAAEQGVKPAFLAYLDESSVLYRPRAVPGRKWMEGHPEPAIRIAWSPSFVQVASAGDLGYTTGPYAITLKDPKDPYAVHGRFATVWRRRAGGPWRVALDIGVATPEPKTAAGGGGETLAYGRPLAAVRAPASGDAAAADEAEKSALLKADRVFGAEAAAGAAAAYAAHAADGAQLLRSDGPPAVGIQAIRAALAANPFYVTWQPAEAEVSRSGDLGYVYGTADFGHLAGAPTRPAAYLRIWERAPGGDWKIALDLLDPLPPPPPEVPG